MYVLTVLLIQYGDVPVSVFFIVMLEVLLPVIVIFFYFSLSPWLARLFCGQGSIVMICIQSVLINLNLNLNFIQIRQQKLEARKEHFWWFPGIPFFVIYCTVDMHTYRTVFPFLWGKGLQNDAENNWSVYTLLHGLSMVVACTRLWDPADIQVS